MITQEYLKSKVEYDPITGYFTYLKSNLVAIAHDQNGYATLKIDRKTYKAHRLAFLYMTGCIPAEVDHKNLVRDDNRWENIREATRQQNCFNTISHKDSLTGYKGVCFRKNRNHYKAQIKINGKEIYLGSFKTAEEANKAYEEAAKKYHGEFARW